MLEHVVSKGNEDAKTTSDDSLAKAMAGGNAKAGKMMILRNKVRSVAKMSKMFGVLREESENILKIKQMVPDGKIPKGLLL